MQERADRGMILEELSQRLTQPPVSPWNFALAACGELLLVNFAGRFWGLL
jgi:hypothetical protein